MSNLNHFEKLPDPEERPAEEIVRAKPVKAKHDKGANSKTVSVETYNRTRSITIFVTWAIMLALISYGAWWIIEQIVASS